MKKFIGVASIFTATLFLFSYLRAIEKLPLQGGGRTPFT